MDSTELFANEWLRGRVGRCKRLESTFFGARIDPRMTLPIRRSGELVKNVRRKDSTFVSIDPPDSAMNEGGRYKVIQSS